MFSRFKGKLRYRPCIPNCKRAQIIWSLSTWTVFFPVTCQCFNNLVNVDVCARFNRLGNRYHRNILGILSIKFASGNHCETLMKNRVAVTVKALLTDTLVSGQLYLRPPCLKTRFNSHTNSVFLKNLSDIFTDIPVSGHRHFQRLRLRLFLCF